MAMKIDFHFVPFPRQIWDEAIDLSHNGFRLLGYLIRHLVGFSNQEIKLTDDEIMNGRKKQNGERIDKGCGIKSRNGLREAREELEQLNWIKVETDTSDKARIKRYYTLVIDPTIDNKDTTNITNAKLQGQKMILSVQKMTGEGQKMSARGSKNDTHVSQNDPRTNNKDIRDFKEKENIEERRKEIGISQSLNASLDSPPSKISLDVKEKTVEQSKSETLSNKLSSPEAEEAKEPVKPAKTKTPSDPRSRHPAIGAIRDIIGRFPDKLIWDEIIETLGEEPDKEKLNLCAKEWAKKTTNLGNLSVWLFDWYRNGLPLGAYQNSAIQQAGNSNLPMVIQPPKKLNKVEENLKNVDEAFAFFDELRARKRAEK